MYIVIATFQSDTKVYLFESAEQAHDWQQTLHKLLWSTEVYLSSINYDFGFSHIPNEGVEVDVSDPDRVTTKHN